MEVEASGEYVGAGESFERDVGSVGTSADGLDFGLDACHLHSLDGLLHDVVMGLYLLAHIIILVTDFDLDSALAVFGVDEFGHFGHHFLAGLKFLPVVVADDVCEVRLFDRSLE